MSEERKRAILDYDQCAELQQPFETPEEAEAALQAFFADVYAARCKHGIANVVFAVKDSIKGSGPCMIDGFCGSEIEMESMAAWLLGMRQSARQDLIRKVLEQGLSSGLKKLNSRT